MISLAAMLGFALTTSACTSLPSLVKEQRYPEAICKVYDASEKDVQTAAPTLASLGHPRWRVRRIFPDLTGVDDPYVTQFFASHLILVIETQVDPVTGLQPLFPQPGEQWEGEGLPKLPTFEITGAGDLYAAGLWDVGSVARITGETSPLPQQMITHIDWGAVLIAAMTDIERCVRQRERARSRDPRFCSIALVASH